MAINERNELYEPIAYRISDACRVAGIGKSKLYALAAEGKLRLSRVVGRTLVPRAELQRLIARDSDRWAAAIRRNGQVLTFSVGG